MTTAGERSSPRARKGVGGRVSTPARARATYVEPSLMTAECSLQPYDETRLTASQNNVAAKLPRYYLTVTQVNGYAAAPPLGVAEEA